jgi:hypothetical protein
MGRAFVVGAILAFAMAAASADAATCRNAKGKSVKCPTPGAARLCLDRTGKRAVKCGANSQASPGLSGPYIGLKYVGGV